VPEQAVVLAGARDLDAPEELRLEASSVKRLAVAELRDPLALPRALHETEAGGSGVYLHLDLDVLDLAVARVNVYGASRDLSLRDWSRRSVRTATFARSR
jgi:arginase family enzyme